MNITKSHFSEWKQHVWSNSTDDHIIHEHQIEKPVGLQTKSIRKHSVDLYNVVITQQLGTYGPDVWLPRRWNHFSCGVEGHLAQDTPQFWWNKPKHIFVTLCSELKKNTVNLWVSAVVFFLLLVLKEKAYRMSHEMIGCFKTEAATGQTLDQARTRLSTSHRPSGRNSRRGTEPNLNNPSSGRLGWLMRCYAAAMTPLSSLLFPITTYTHSGMSVLPKTIAPDITVSITQRVTTAVCELTHTLSRQSVVAHSTVRPIV